MSQPRNPFNHWLILLIIGVAALIVPLAQRQQGEIGFTPLFIASICSSTLALATLQLGWLLRSQRLLTFGTVTISLLAGSLKAFVEWWLLGSFGLGFTELLTSMAVGALSWAIILTVTVITLERLGKDWSLNLAKKQAIQRARELHASLEQQYEWLKLQQLEGLNNELAKHFVSLVKKLNTDGRVEESYAEIAKELKQLARRNVRNRSIASLKSTEKLTDQVARLFTVQVSPSAASALLLFSSLAYSIRMGTLPDVWLMILVMSTGFFLWLNLTPRTLSSALWTPAVASLFGFLTMIMTDKETEFAILQSLAVGLWALAVLALVASLELLRTTLLDGKTQLSKELSSITSDSQWLSIRLEELNLEIAKYLHAVLQTRLMAFAIRLESTELSEEQLIELRDLLSAPMREFSEVKESLEARMTDLSSKWEPILSIEMSLRGLHFRALDAISFDLIQEAIGNAFYHGKANELQIEIVDSDIRTITVSDNGLGPQGGVEGMGSYLLRKNALSWSMADATQQGSVLTIQLSPPR